MDRVEKGYFVKFAKMLGKGNNHITLFSILSDMDSFDKDILLKKLKRKKLHISNLNVTLHHLYQFTLKSLRLFHEKNYYKIQIHNLISEAEILIGKNLKSQALKILRKAETISKELNSYTTLIEIQKIKAVLLVATSKTQLIEGIQESYSDIEHSLDILEEEIYFRKLNHLTFGCFRINKMDAQHQHKNILDYVTNNPRLNSKEIPNCFYAQSYKENTLGLKESIYTNKEKVNIHYKKRIAIWNDSPTMIKAEPLIYRNIISNYLVNAIFIKNVNDFDEQMKNLENIPTRFENDKIELFQSKIYLEQLYYLNYRKLEQAYQLIEENKLLLEKYNSKMNFSRLTIIQYNFLIICFLKEKHNEAIIWLNKILYEKKAEPRKNVRLFCRIMELILHYELDNYDLLDSLITSVWRKRKSDDSFYEYSESILRHIKALAKANSKSEKQKLSKEFLEILNEFQQQSPVPTGIEELIFWTVSNIEQISIEEAYVKWDK